MQAPFGSDRPYPSWSAALCLLAAALGAASCSGKRADGSVPIGLDKVPHRKPGLWAQKITLDKGSAVLSAQLCIDEPAEKIMLLGAQSPPGGRCDAPKFYRRPDGALSFSTTCRVGDKKTMTSEGVFTGDLNVHYTAVITSTVSGGAGAPESHILTATAVWSGPCPDGARGGDMFLTNGLRFNILGPGPNSVFSGAH